MSEVVDKKSPSPPIVINVGFKDLFYFANAIEIKLLYIIGAVCAMIQGILMPSMAIFFGAILAQSVDTTIPVSLANSSNIINTSVNSNNNNNNNGVVVAKNEKYDSSEVDGTLIFFLIFTILMFASGFLNNLCFSVGAEMQVFKFREAYLRKVLLLDMKHYDDLDVYGVPVSMSQHTNALKDASGQQLGMVLQSVFQFISGYTIAMYFAWRIALVISAAIPILLIAICCWGAMMSSLTTNQYSHHRRAGEVVTQALMNLKTILSLNAQNQECEKYLVFQEYARQDGLQTSIRMGLMVGLISVGIYVIQCVGMYYGGYLIFENEINPRTGEPFTGADVITVYFALVMGVMGLMGVGPWVTAYGKAKPALKTYFEMEKKIDAMDSIELAYIADSNNNNSNNDNKMIDINKVVLNEDGKTLPIIQFKNITFQYPSRKKITANDNDDTNSNENNTKKETETRDETNDDDDIKNKGTDDLRPVLENVNFEIFKGQKVAMVGQSGSGKSTIAQLLERYYDVDDGEISISGTNIRDIDINKYRRTLSYVTQEPVLFGGLTIRENIVLGLQREVKDDEIKQVCQDSLIWDLIESLPNGLNTMPGTGGLNLSGGQKQRIAIARALIRKPSILLLDEATSALDYQSEKMVQETLDLLLKNMNCTILTIAHRLSTVKNSDNIFVLKEGKILEQGTHEELYNNEGEYFNLIKLQEAKEVKEDGLKFKTSGKSINKMIKNHEQIREDKLNKNTNGRSNSSKKQNTSTTWEETQKKSERERKLTKLGAETYKKENYLKRLFYLNTPLERLMYIPAFFISIIQGMISPISSLLIVESMGAFYNPDKYEMKEQINFICLWYIVLCIVGYCSQLITQIIFGYNGGQIEMRLKYLVVESLLGQDVSYFEEEDKPEQSPGAISALISEKAWQISMLTGFQLATNINGISGLLGGIILGLFFAWKLALVITCCIPFFIGFIWYNSKINNQGDWLKEEDKQLSAAGNVVNEGIVNLRTIRSLGMHAAEQLCYLYVVNMKKILNRDIKRARARGTISGIANAFSFGFYIVGFGYGNYLMEHEGLSFKNMFLCVMCIVSGAQAASYSGGWLPDAVKSRAAAAFMFGMIDRKPNVQTKDFTVCGYPAVSSGNNNNSSSEKMKNAEHYKNANAIQKKNYKMLKLRWKKRDKEKKEKEKKKKEEEEEGSVSVEDIDYSTIIKKEILEHTNADLLMYKLRRHLINQNWFHWNNKNHVSENDIDDGYRITKSMKIKQVEFKNVCFNYPGRASVPVLKNLSFKISAGQSIGLCGPSGGGKSTIFQLLQRFYDPIVLNGVTSGSILVTFSDDELGIETVKDLKNVASLCEFRRRIGYVGQEPVLFNISARDNVMFGISELETEGISNEQFEKLANACNIDFIKPAGDETSSISLTWDDALLGAKGQKISGGQKQRLCIMRSLLRKPEILLLDEATSALDANAEKEVQDALDNVTALGNTTTLTIAHRLSTIQNSTLILVVSEGCIVESGSHEMLMQMENLYWNLVKNAERGGK